LQCAELLKQAKTKYGAKDLMGALKLFEDVLAQVMVDSNLYRFVPVYVNLSAVWEVRPLWLQTCARAQCAADLSVVAAAAAAAAVVAASAAL
jgi:hypothetical protein